MGDKISVIVPVYNVEIYLEKCVKSILNQTYKNLEIILVNDGSTDNSGNICDELAKIDNRIVVYHKENGGVSSARNLGISRLTGDYFTFVDSDDILLDKAIEYLHELIYCYDNINKVKYKADISICGVKNVYDFSSNYNMDINQKKVHIWNSKEALSEFLIAKKTSFFPVAKLFNKNLVGASMFNESFILAEDALFISELMLSKNLKVSFGESIGYLYCHRLNSATTKKEYSRKVMDTINVHNIIRKKICLKYPELKEELTTRKNWSYIHVYDKLLFYKESKEVYQIKNNIRKYLIKSLYNILKDRNFSLSRKFSLLTLVLSEKIYKQIVNKNRK